MAPRAPAAARRFARLAPFGALVGLGLLVLTGRIWVAIAFAVVLFGILQARTVSPSFKRALESGLARTAHAIAHVVGLVLSWTLLTLIFVLVMVPVAVVGWVVGLVLHRPLGRPRGLAGDGWIPRAALSRSAAPPRMFGTEPTRARLDDEAEETDVVEPSPVPDPDAAGAGAGKPAPRPRRRRRAPRLATVVMVVAGVLLFDLLAGAVLTASGVAPGEYGDIRRAKQQAVTQTMASPAISSEPWAEEFGANLLEFQLQQPEYLPFVISGQHEFHSRYLNTTDSVRVSYRPSVPASVEPLQVAFFGGSTMFGIGQRDDHTIPSEFARRAEEHGVPVEVHNFGFPARVTWQELQDFERRVAEGGSYDVAVFYDGFNEFLAQQSEFSIHPTHIGASTFDLLADEFHDVHEREPGPFDGLRELGETYRTHSAASRLLDEWFGEDDPPSWMAPPATATQEEQTDAALDVYERAIELIGQVGDDHGTSVHFFWQPTKAGWDPSVTDRLPAGVTDLSSVLDGRQDDLYIDEVHTNEEGARLMAEALWDELGPELERAAAGR